MNDDLQQHHINFTNEQPGPPIDQVSHSEIKWSNEFYLPRRMNWIWKSKPQLRKTIKTTKCLQWCSKCSAPSLSPITHFPPVCPLTVRMFWASSKWWISNRSRWMKTCMSISWYSSRRNTQMIPVNSLMWIEDRAIPMIVQVIATSERRTHRDRWVPSITLLTQMRARSSTRSPLPSQKTPSRQSNSASWARESKAHPRSHSQTWQSNNKAHNLLSWSNSPKKSNPKLNDFKNSIPTSIFARRESWTSTHITHSQSQPPWSALIRLLTFQTERKAALASKTHPPTWSDSWLWKSKTWSMQNSGQRKQLMRTNIWNKNWRKLNKRQVCRRSQSNRMSNHCLLSRSDTLKKKRMRFSTTLKSQSTRPTSLKASWRQKLMGRTTDWQWMMQARNSPIWAI